jgi:ABC-type ATPase involved in cell division
MVYTGYIGGKMKDVIQPIQIRTRDILGKGNQHRRFVFNCFVIGHSGSGKTAFLESTIKSVENNRIILN